MVEDPAGKKEYIYVAGFCATISFVASHTSTFCSLFNICEVFILILLHEDICKDYSFVEAEELYLNFVNRSLSQHSVWQHWQSIQYYACGIHYCIADGGSNTNNTCFACTGGWRVFPVD